MRTHLRRPAPLFAIRRTISRSVAHGAFFFAFVVAIGLAACIAPRPPRLACSSSSTWGLVHAADLEIAREVAQVVDEVAPQVAARVPGLELRHLDVRVVRGFADPLWGGATFQMSAGFWMEIPTSSLPDLVHSTLAHEMIHYWLGPDWEPLPAVIEEGLADVVAARIVPEESAVERVGYAVLLSTAFSGGLELSFARDEDERSSRSPLRVFYADLDREHLPPTGEILSLSSSDLNAITDRENRLLFYGLGYLFASRIGIERLYELCLQARERGFRTVPSGWLYAAAGIDAGDPKSWRRAIEGMLGREEREVLARMQPVGEGVYRLARVR